MAAWRGRKRTKWSDKNKYGWMSCDEKMQSEMEKARKEINKFIGESECMELSSADIKRANIDIKFAEAQLMSLNCALPSSEVTQGKASKSFKSKIHFRRNIDVFAVDEQLRKATPKSQEERRKRTQGNKKELELSKDQEVFLSYFRRFLSRKTDDHEDIMLLLGAPGTGKSIAAVEACEVGQKCGNVVRTSWNGIAAAIVNGGTIATTFAVPSNQKRNSPVIDLKPNELLQLEARIGNLDISLLVIDEVSTLSPRVFVTIDARLRQLMSNPDTPFGGVSILLVGDFMQIPPFSKMTLCKCSLLVAWYEKTKRIPHGYDRTDFAANGIFHRAADLFNRCKLVQINKQLRCKDTDIDHQNLIMKMWKGHQLEKEDFQQYHFLSKKDSQQDHAWEFATILVTGNKVRQAMNAAQAKRFASRHKTHLVKWPLKVQYLRGDKDTSGQFPAGHFYLCCACERAM